MNKLTTTLAASIALISALTFAVQASPMAAKSAICPACHMKMMTTKSAGAPVPVKIKGVTYYCCKACAAGKAHMKSHM